MDSNEKKELHEVMTREICVMREVLSSMHMEQKAILQKDCASLSLISENRTALLSVMQRLRSLILSKIDHVEEEEACEYSHLKEQIMTLVDKIQSARQHNRCLRVESPYILPMVKVEKPKIRVMTMTKYSPKGRSD